MDRCGQIAADIPQARQPPRSTSPDFTRHRTTVIQNLFAGLVLAICVVLLVRLCLSPLRQRRLDAAALRSVHALRQRTLSLWHWRAHRKSARHIAEEALRKASQGEWTGNVYKPKSFRKPRKPH
jgi:hypothetical protein